MKLKRTIIFSLILILAVLISAVIYTIYQNDVTMYILRGVSIAVILITACRTFLFAANPDPDYTKKKKSDTKYNIAIFIVGALMIITIFFGVFLFRYTIPDIVDLAIDGETYKTLIVGCLVLVVCVTITCLAMSVGNMILNKADDEDDKELENEKWVD